VLNELGTGTTLPIIIIIIVKLWSLVIATAVERWLLPARVSGSFRIISREIRGGRSDTDAGFL
jgi:hypothetical protein